MSLAIKKTKYHNHNGTDFDTHHHETQAAQVKIMNGGVVVSDIEEMILKGKPVSGVDIATLTSTGMYIISSCTGLPFTATASTYLMKVEDAGTLTQQTVYDHINNDIHFRTLINKAKNTNWRYSGDKVQGDIVMAQGNIGDLNDLLTDVDSSLVHAINELKTDADGALQKITLNESVLTDLAAQLQTHNHDSRYFRNTGGDLTGSASVPNNASFQGKNASGTKLNIGKVDDGNVVVIGDTTANGAVIRAKGGNLSVYDGVKSTKVFHAGNMGAGSGLDADKLDGVQGSSFAQRGEVNDFTANQGIIDGNNLTFKAAAGSSQAGGVYFRASDGTLKGSIVPTAAGDLKFASGTFSRHQISANGEFVSHSSHIIDSANRDATVTLRKGSTDKGVGLGIDATNNLLLKDEQSGVTLMKADRASGIVEFGRHIKIQGRRLFLQQYEPSDAESGDIWFDL